MQVFTRSRFRFVAWAVAAAAAIVPAVSSAQEAGYPNKPIRMIVGFSAGGSTDVIARAIAAKMSSIVRHQVIVDNRPGADSLIGTQLVARAEPDGYTILVASGSHSINASLYPDTKLDPVKDFEAITLIGDAANFLVVYPGVHARTVEELIALARQSPGRLNYASSASTTFLATELFKSMAGIQMTQVPYKGSGPAVPALLAGEVEVAITSIVTMLPHVQSGRARALAVTGQSRSKLAPDVPTVTEKGLPGYVASTWYGVFAPAGTPGPIVQYLNRTLREVMADPLVRTQLEGQGVDITPNDPQAFKAFVKEDQDKWAKVVKESGAAPVK